MSAASEFVAGIQSASFADVFNPYSDVCAVHDKPAAPVKRSKSLRDILEAAAARGVHSLWIGRDLGYRGGRRTGLALTDDMHVSVHAARWGVATDRYTKGQPVKERTAEIAWRVLERIDVPVFLWNVFPLHPHEPERPFTNRSHRARERAAGEEMLSELMSLVRPEVVVALGADAARSSARMAPALTVRVRHPSYGGQAQFLSQMSELYQLRACAMRKDDLFDRSCAS
ncbi:MAG TPA: uracil-DNA glycosylase [Xanthobacteraceae bacterium]|nr:uracil-DNA glycosylase [Xanthobacteraceae bacterium]